MSSTTHQLFERFVSPAPVFDHTARCYSPYSDPGDSTHSCLSFDHFQTAVEARDSMVAVVPPLQLAALVEDTHPGVQSETHFAFRTHFDSFVLFVWVVAQGTIDFDHIPFKSKQYLQL